MERQFPYKLYLVISEEACCGRDMLWVAEQAVKGGVDLVQIREKNKNYSDFLESSLMMKEMLDSYSVPLIVNDNPVVAVNCNAYGIHVGNSDIPPSEIKKKWPGCNMIGYSVEYMEQLSGTEIEFSNYLGVSPVFSTPTKTDTVTEWGLKGVEQIRTLTDKPLVAIGGINQFNAKQVIHAGADCLAVVSAICAAENPVKAAETLRNLIETA
ncbi:thiamine phosphate synthase [Flavobacterium alkalisoli]|uniref:Thiamine-phosphate synthase n=1 Tax=Flavobacterium alkalisoli TaxID=2602769 RepID=A0A5B9FMN9_9FLAO|nr:thiamine phosphate synthase [Flavobacterium alkalisoli]QEE48150.1 thiamine phosphate synthase [Flavobacterium alkalisoli]